MNIKVFTGRLILTTDDEFHEVDLFNPDKKLKKGYGYIHNDYVFIYRGKKEKYLKEHKSLVPGIYSDVGDEYIFVLPESVSDRQKYSIDAIIQLDIDKIFEEINENENEFIDPEDIEIINSNSESYTPTLREDDDFLKYIVKKAILDKEINLKNYRHKFSNQYALNNMKSGLKKDTKMTVTNFKIWCEVLGLKWEMKIEDSGSDRLSPLNEPIVITSENF